MYVAITRAKSFCMVSYCRFRMMNGQVGNTLPSRFISDIHPRYLKALNGAKLQYPKSEPVKERPAAAAPAMRITPPLAPRTFKTIGAQAPTPAAKPQAQANDCFTVHKAGELTEGMTIVHKDFGRGEIMSIDTSTANHKIVVQFSSTAPKTLLLKYARFQIL